MTWPTISTRTVLPSTGRRWPRQATSSRSSRPPRATTTSTPTTPATWLRPRRPGCTRPGTPSRYLTSAALPARPITPCRTAPTPRLGTPCRWRLTSNTTPTGPNATGYQPRRWSRGSPRSPRRCGGSPGRGHSFTPPRTGGTPAPATAPRSPRTRCGWPRTGAAALRCRPAGLTGHSGSSPAKGTFRA